MIKRSLAPFLLGLVALLLIPEAPTFATPPSQDANLRLQADALLAKGLEMYQAGDYPAALENLQAALEAYRSLGMEDGEGHALRHIGNVFASLGQYADALAYYDRALAIYSKLDDGDSQAKTLYNIGNVHGLLEEYPEAVPYFVQAAALFQELGDREAEARSLYNLGSAYWKQEQPEQALNHLQEAQRIFQEAGNGQEADQAGHMIDLVYSVLASQADLLTGQAEAMFEAGEYQAALEGWESALEMYRAIDSIAGEANVLNSIGVVHYYLGHYPVARQSFEAALALFGELGDQDSTARTLNNLGNAALAFGEYQEALNHFTEALALQRELGDIAQEAMILSNIGNVYDRLGRSSQALVEYEAALIIFRKAGLPEETARLLNNIGNVHRKQGDDSQALAHYQDALSTSRELGDRQGQAITLQNIAAVYGDQGRYEEALLGCQEALDLWVQIGDPLGQAQSRNNMGYVLQKLGRYTDALSQLEQALALNRDLGDPAEEALILDNLGQVYYKMNDWDRALDYYRQALAGYEGLRGRLTVEEINTAYASTYWALYDRTISLLMALNLPDEAFSYSEQSRARALLNQLGNTHIDPRSLDDRALVEEENTLRLSIQALDRQISEEWAKPRAQRNQELIERLSIQLQEKRGAYATLLETLKLKSPKYAALVSVNPITLEEAQALLQEQGPGVTLISYFVGEKQLTIFVLSAQAFHAQVVPVTRQELHRQIEGMLSQMRAAPLMPDAWLAPARALYGWLIAPVKAQLPAPDPEHPQRLGIIPHDLLHYLPFGLLYDGENILLTGHTLSFVPSASSLQFISGNHPLQPQPPELLAIAYPDAPGMPRLESAEAEARAVAGLYNAQPFLGSEATEARFKREAGKYELIHIAAHSDYQPSNPLFSAILLAADGAQDGRLETHEVLNLDLPKTELVVLSACQTHLGELSAGDELVGLERAFLRAGSSNLLTTLWSVDDVATAMLMEQFYGHLQAGTSKAEALRLAQIETRAVYPDPYYWAGFVLVGGIGDSPQSRQQDQVWPWLAGIAIFLAILGIVGAGWFLIRRRFRRIEMQ